MIHSRVMKLAKPRMGDKAPMAIIEVSFLIKYYSIANVLNDEPTCLSM